MREEVAIGASPGIKTIRVKRGSLRVGQESDTPWGGRQGKVKEKDLTSGSCQVKGDMDIPASEVPTIKEEEQVATCVDLGAGRETLQQM